MSVKVSVIMPIYNEEEYLADCLNSVLKQTLKEIQLICVNDGSTDRSAVILNEFAAKDSRVQIITQNNSGAGKARNVGMEIAVGEYFSFLDADDLFDEKMLEKAYNQAQKYNCEIVSFGSCRYDEITKSILPPVAGNMKDEYLPDREVFSYRDVKQDFFGTFYSWAWDKLFKASFVKANKLFFQNQRSINDLYFVCCALVRAERVSVLKDQLVIKRVNNLNAITTNYARAYNYDCFYKALKALKEQLIKWEIYELLKRDYVNYATQFVIRALENFKYSLIYEKLYNLLKSEWLEVLGIAECDQEFYYRVSDFRKISDISQMSCAEYKQEDEIRIMSGKYLFPFEAVDRDSMIVLYGAGEVGKAFYRQIQFSNYCKISMWCDKKGRKYRDIVIKPPKEIENVTFAKVIIAVNAKKIAEEIKEELCCLGIAKEKIIWRSPEINI